MMMIICCVRRILFLLLAVLHISTITGQGLFSSSTISGEDDKIGTRLNGHALGTIYGGSLNSDFPAIFGEFALQAKVSKNRSFLYGDIRFREGIFFSERKSIIQLKEAYSGYMGEKASFYIGNQIVKWGRADGFNPSDNICPNDYFFLSTDPDDQRLSNFMLRAKLLLFLNTELELIAIPVFRPSNYRYDLFDMGEGAFFSDPVLPFSSIKNSSFALRFNSDLSGFGYSVSYFHGYDPFYGFTINSLSFVPETEIIYKPAFYRKNTLASDFVLPFKSSILRGEFALNLTENYEENMHIPYPDISYVIGLEHNFSNYIVILQYVGKKVLGFEQLTLPVPGDLQNSLEQIRYATDMVYYESELFNRKIFQHQKEYNHAVFLLLSKSLAYELVTIKMSGYYNVTSEELMLRPDLRWNMTDVLSLSFGASFMMGPENSVFNKAGKILNGIFCGLKASF